jgi:hypothetical protein
MGELEVRVLVGLPFVHLREVGTILATEEQVIVRVMVGD